MALLDNKMPINEKLHIILEELEKDKLLVETNVKTFKHVIVFFKLLVFFCVRFGGRNIRIAYCNIDSF